MFTGEFLFTIFQIFGLWRPSSLTEKWRISLYNIYTLFNVTIHLTFTFSLFLHLFQVTENADKFTQTLFYFAGVFAVFIKIISFLLKNNYVIELHAMFSNKNCQPRDTYELKILENISRKCRINSIIFHIMMASTTSLLFFSSMEKGGKFSLPFDVMLPYNIHKSGFIFFSTYLYQTYATWMTAMSTASIECFVMLIILQIGGQLDIIIHRLSLLPVAFKKNSSQFSIQQYESRIIKDCVSHHNYIFELGHKLNQLFSFVLFIQFFASMAGIFAIIYQVSRIDMNNQTSWLFFIYLSSILFQIFLYSFHGQKLIEESLAISHKIWHIDWIDLSNKTKKDLTIIMIRCGRPIKITGLIVSEMSLATFVKVLKSSYSGYNLTCAL